MLPRPSILVTGALGYIGSHTLIDLVHQFDEYNVIALDNLSNSSIDVLDRIHGILAHDNATDRIKFVQRDVQDTPSLRSLFHTNQIVAVVHFAALKAVQESVDDPLRYYRENVGGLLALLEVMGEFGCDKIIFSSSATVYGSLSGLRKTCHENTVRHMDSDDDDGVQGCVGLTNPYGRTKWMCEAILHDQCVSDSSFQAIALRYFNPVGAHPSGMLREQPRGPPSNLIPCITTAMQRGEPVQIFGNDYETHDGTAVRDFIHVVDLARGHSSALRKLLPLRKSVGWLREHMRAASQSSVVSSSASTNSHSTSSPSTPLTPFSEPEGAFPSVQLGLEREKNELQVYNLGTGTGSTVTEVIAAMEKASKGTIYTLPSPRRKGDVAYSVANVQKARVELDWQAKLTLDDACHDVCRGLIT